MPPPKLIGSGKINPLDLKQYGRLEEELAGLYPCDFVKQKEAARELYHSFVKKRFAIIEVLDKARDTRELVQMLLEKSRGRTLKEKKRKCMKKISALLEFVGAVQKTVNEYEKMQRKEFFRMDREGKSVEDTLFVSPLVHAIRNRHNYYGFIRFILERLA